MRRIRRGPLAAALFGAAAFGAAVLVPATAAEAPRGLNADLATDPCFVAGCEPGPPGWVDRIDARMAGRMPLLSYATRRRLSRALVTEAEAARLDPLLVLALIEVESSWQLDARSERGALGLMQLREPTLRREVERAGLSWDAGDPATNVRAGIRYLRRLLDAFGREELALMAYNAGPNRILGYLRDGEIPERFRLYPRKVHAEARRLRRAWSEEWKQPSAVSDQPSALRLQLTAQQPSAEGQQLTAKAPGGRRAVD